MDGNRPPCYCCVMKSPKLIEGILPPDVFDSVKQYAHSIDKTAIAYDKNLGRVLFNGGPLVDQIHRQTLLPIVREAFNSPTLIPSWHFGIWYFYKPGSKGPKLSKHKDDGPCTYSVNLCVYQQTPWDIYVDGQRYELNENSGLIFNGEAQEHWRDVFPNSPINEVCNIVFFYAEPEHPLWHRIQK